MVIAMENAIVPIILHRYKDSHDLQDMESYLALTLGLIYVVVNLGSYLFALYKRNTLHQQFRKIYGKEYDERLEKEKNDEEQKRKNKMEKSQQDDEDDQEEEEGDKEHQEIVNKEDQQVCSSVDDPVNGLRPVKTFSATILPQTSKSSESHYGNNYLHRDLDDH
jgi:hypothetical protein